MNDRYTNQCTERDPVLNDDTEEEENLTSRIRHILVGAKRNLEDPSLFHKIALIPVLAWIGLGADGVSSSSYGPAEGFITLTTHTYIAIFLALATAVTVFVISFSYTRIIEHFPGGGGGYIVANHTISEKAGVISGSALLVDYVLTITVSVAACADALFSFLPAGLQVLKLLFAMFLVVVLIVLNFRGVRESVTILAPIFLIFIVTHILLLGSGIFSHMTVVAPVASQIQSSFQADILTIGVIGILAIFLRAYSFGAGTYTGLEAVANGMQIMREPRVNTGKRTMAYMAISLALISAGLFLCYLLWQVHPVPGQTLNAVLAGAVFASWPLGGLLAFITILAEGALLLVAAQTGFIDGPRVMANMAIDSWLPRRFALLSERFTMNNGIMIMGIASLLLLFYSRGSILVLVTMYAINVFITFSLSQYGMARFVYKNRKQESHWKRQFPVFIVGFLLCSTILIITLFEKFGEGAWLTVFITALVVSLCFLIKSHYQEVAEGIRKLDAHLMTVPSTGKVNTNPPDPHKKTAVQLVTGYNGFGVRTFFTITKTFPDVYDNFIFASVAVVDSGTFKGKGEIDALQDSVKKDLEKYTDLARGLGFSADYRIVTGTDAVAAGVPLCQSIVKEFPHSTIFAGQIVFRHEQPFQKILHNETAFALQRRLQFKGITTVIMPIRAEP